MLLPPDFISMMRGLIGADEVSHFLAAMDEPCPVSIRVNRRKMLSEVADELHRQFGLSADNRVAWCADGYYLPQRPQFILDPLLHAGAYYVQEASSMFVAHLINIYIGENPVRALDLCAAPGGKSTLLEAALPKGSWLTCNEVVPKRYHILQENMAKWGGNQLTVCNMQPARFGQMGAEFDLILCDVPCSGEGMMRKDADAVEQWSLELVDMCSRRQRDIVSDIWPCLAEGGLMIYSTCTYNTRENEENVAWIANELGADILPVNAPAEWNIVGNLLNGASFSCAHFMPHRTKGEGFFCAILRKRQNEVAPLPLPNQTKLTASHRSTPPGRVAEEPARVPVSRTDALRYLHGDAIRLCDDAPRGIVTITYKGLPLGQAKNIGTRANNLYPKEWRIRQQI